MLPDCGPPPKVSFATVTYTNTSIDSRASYQCKTGYHLIGSETAVCWRISENRLQKWIDWLFVPTCELNCPAKIGRHGNVTVAKFHVSACNLTGFDTFSASLNCGPPVPYAVNRKPLKIPGEEAVERIVFYGSDLCISERVLKVRSYENSVVLSSTKCKSFCLQYPFEIRDIVVYDELVYARDAQKDARMSIPSVGKGISDFNVGQTTREQKVKRYTCPSP